MIFGNFINYWLLFLDISAGEILVIIVVIFLVFGPNKIPEIARTLGKGFNEVRNASNQIMKEINEEVDNIKDNLNVNPDEEPDRKEESGRKTDE